MTIYPTRSSTFAPASFRKTTALSYLATIGVEERSSSYIQLKDRPKHLLRKQNPQYSLRKVGIRMERKPSAFVLGTRMLCTAWFMR